MTQLTLFESDTKATVERFRAKGVKRLFVKYLAERQDNEKNQIYISKSLDGIANTLRAKIEVGSVSTSRSKRASSKGDFKFEAALNWVWMGSGYESPAPGMKLIYYFQYPEVRLSGFLEYSPNPPDSLRRDNLKNYGRRTLVFGVAGSTVYGSVLAGLPGTCAPVIANTIPSQISDVLLELELEDNDAETVIKSLLGEWHQAVRLSKKYGIREFRGDQAPGFTLEALCGIPTNSDSGPDLLGAELKTFRFSSKVSLMTPVANGGEWKRLGAERYLLQYGHKGKDGVSTWSTGVRRVGKITNGHTLVLTEDRTTVSGIKTIALIRVIDGLVLESWSEDAMVSSWLKKHDAAFYVRYVYDRQLNRVMFDGYFKCAGTSPERLVNMIKSGDVYYDPAHSLIPAEKPPLHVRPQWRLGTAKTKFFNHLKGLYVDVEQAL